jgi:nicotinate-nucleotide adenylyltransferase
VSEQASPASQEGEAGVVGVFGGSFNPPHLAHVLALAVVLARFDVARILVVPTYQHPFAKALASYDDRVRMCELAMGWLPRVEISRVEEELGGESRTLRTLEHLRARHPAWSLRFIMGADLVLEASKWFGFDKITGLAPPIVLGRVGVTYEGAPPAVLPAISSTEVRTMIREERWEELEPLVPREALAYARARGLYTSDEGQASR